MSLIYLKIINYYININKMHQKSIINIKNLSIETIKNILKIANDIIIFSNMNQIFNFKQNMNFALLFFEPSTRTNFSFQTAINKLNGTFINYNQDYSSHQKGESLYDTIKTMESYSDALIVRHPERGMVEKISNIASIPVINAGDGNGEHPTQALLDLFTILQYHKPPFKIAFTGDLKNSRTVHSLIYLLEKLYDDITYYFVSCDSLKLEENLFNLKNKRECDSLEQIIDNIDVLYMTRIQKERHINEKNVFNINLNKKLLNKSNKNMIVLHPLPRNDEIPVELDNDPKCKYFEQMKNGVYVRMAILSQLQNS